MGIVIKEFKDFGGGLCVVLGIDGLESRLDEKSLILRIDNLKKYNRNASVEVTALSKMQERKITLNHGE